MLTQVRLTIFLAIGINMAAAGITFNDKKMKKVLKGMVDNAKDIKTNDKKFWSIMSAIAFADVLDHFEKEKGPGGKWQAWSDIYATRMAKIGKGGNKILQDTGRLRQSTQLADTNSRRKKGQLVFNPAKTSDGKPYALDHDLGEGGMPQRQFMWLSLKALNKMSKALSVYIVKGKKK